MTTYTLPEIEMFSEFNTSVPFPGSVVPVEEADEVSRLALEHLSVSQAVVHETLEQRAQRMKKRRENRAFALKRMKGVRVENLQRSSKNFCERESINDEESMLITDPEALGKSARTPTWVANVLQPPQKAKIKNVRHAFKRFSTRKQMYQSALNESNLTMQTPDSFATGNGSLLAIEEFAKLFESNQEKETEFDELLPYEDENEVNTELYLHPIDIGKEVKAKKPRDIIKEKVKKFKTALTRKSFPSLRNRKSIRTLERLHLVSENPLFKKRLSI
eukprot:snap_masked-scaffold_60-processed-gene-0.2-mRNA-1 protein AED:1.00 eAED:1.00 QI:0/-1/0/0/-1/1/1/0/274